MLGHLDRLHARAEAHGRVGLGEAAGHAARDAGGEVAGAEGARVVLSFGRDEEEDGALCGGFDPGPGDETLVDCSTSRVSVCYTQIRIHIAAYGVYIHPKTPPLLQILCTAPAIPS